MRRVTGRGVLSAQDVTDALGEIRRHLLDADVTVEVVEGFLERGAPCKRSTDCWSSSSK